MKTPELATLIGAYYHQDFDGLWPTLDAYLANSTDAERGSLVREIDELLQNHPDDVQVEQYLDALGNCADRSRAPGGYRGWLEEIARRVRTHLGD